MLKTAALVVHPDRPRAAETAGAAEQLFLRKGIHVLYPQREPADGKRAEAVLTFGGDGTLLIGAGYALQYRAPLLGFHLGTLGFLTEGKTEMLPEIIDRLIRGEYETETRGLLEVRVGKDGPTFRAVNDAVVTRGGFARLIRVDTEVNGEYLGTFTADGMIAATPTGSTGYALSAGGPVVAPEVPSTVITPVCPHIFQRSSYIVPDKALVRFHLQEERKQSAELQIDGQSRATLASGDDVWVRGSGETLQLIRMEPYRFFTLTRKKLNEWSNNEEKGIET